MTACVFLGPTLPVAEARAILDAVYLPPVRQGDVYLAVQRHRPRAIGIVDGYFHQVPSVWHKEILWAMAEGVHVFGSASMGALRAAELHAFGMEGVGAIFAAFRDGLFEDDDEVAVVHGPAEIGFVPASEAMVNIRSTLEAAKDQGIIGARTAERLQAIAKSLFYPERRYPDVLKRAASTDLPAGELSAFEAWLGEGRIDQKRADALAMLDRMRDAINPGLPPKSVDYRLQPTTMWRAATAAFPRDEQVEARGGERSIEDWILDEIRLDPAFDGLLRDALLRLLALMEADREGLVNEEDERRRAKAGFRHERRLETGLDFKAWLRANDLERQDLDRLLDDGLLLDKIGDRLRAPSLGLAIDALRLRGGYEGLAARARDKQATLGALEADGDIEGDAQAILWYFQRVEGDRPPDDLNAYAMKRGFRNSTDFRRAASLDYRYRRLANEAP